MEQASCRACVDACPRGAWVIDDAMLGIDTDRCDGCDLCVPACPQGAITGRFAPAVTHTAQGMLAFAACDRAGTDTGRDGRMPCIHAIGLADLLRLRGKGVGFLLTASGDCDACPRGGAIRMARRLEDLDRLLSSRGLDPIAHRPLDAEQWTSALRAAGEQAAARTLSRRSFFRSAIELPRERAEALIDETLDVHRAPGELLPPSSARDPLYPFVPQIDPFVCNGCDACARICPHEAIRLESDAAEAAYRVDAVKCTGCGLCVDLCDQQAIQIRRCAAPSHETITLRSHRCRACGVTFRVPQVQDGNSGLCRVCARTNHHRRLFQVLS
jgi:ferredoxin